MANTLRFKRGLASGLPTGVAGEPLFTTDTFDLYIGTGAANQRYQKYIASGTTLQYLRGDGSLATFPTNIITGTGVSGQVAYFTGANTQTGSNNLFWDNTNERLGIGTATPAFKIDARGSSGTVVIHGQSNVADDIVYYATGTVNGSINAYRALMSVSGSLQSVIRNTNASTGDALFSAVVSPSSTGDPYMDFTTIGGNQWTIGIDNSDSDKLKISHAGTPSTGTAAMTLHTTRNLHIGGITDTGQRLQVTGNSYFNGVVFVNTTTQVSGVAAAKFVVTQTAATADWTATIKGGTTSGGSYGLRIDAGTTAADYPLFIMNSAGTNMIAVNGLGSVGIGSTALTGYNLRVSKNITGSINGFAISQEGVVQSDVNASVNGFYNVLNTQAAVFTLPLYRHFIAVQGTIGAGSSITTQYGFLANSSLIGATNNYGFFGEIPSGTGRWNIYMQGSAANFINGNLQLGSVTAFASGEKLQLTGDARIKTSGTGGLILEATSGTETPNITFLSTTNRYNIDNNSGVLRFFRENVDGSAGAVRMSLTDVGRLILGAGDSGELLQVNGTMRVSGNTTLGGTLTMSSGLIMFLGTSRIFDSGGSLVFGTTANPMIFQGNDGGARQFFFNNTVLIGNSISTGENLQVTGTMKVTGASTFGGILTNSIASSGSALASNRIALFESNADSVIQINVPNANSAGLFFGRTGSAYYAGIERSDTNLNIRNNNINALVISSTGAATFSSSVTTSGNIQTNGAYKYIKSTGFISNQIGQLSDFSASDAGYYFVSGSGIQFVNAGANTFLLSGTGAATFSSSVTANAGFIAGTGVLSSDVSMLFKTDTGDFSLINQRASHSFGIYDNLNTRYNLNFSSTGAATFSSSVTAASLVVDTTTLVVDATNNYVGIGTATPKRHLDVSTNGSPEIVLGALNGGIDQKYWRVYSASDIMRLGYVNDAFTAGTDVARINRSGQFGIMMNPSYTLDVTGEARVSSAIAIGTTPDTNKPFKILKNINATVGINFENTSTSSLAFSAIQMGTDVTGGTKFTNLVYASSGVSASGVYNPDGTSLINNGNGGLNFLGNPIRLYTGGSNGVLRLMLDNEGTTQYTATTPTTNATDGYKQYSADVVAGNAAPHFRTENGGIIKLYQETTGVGNAIFSQGGGTSVLDDSTFDGYTLRQIVKALRNQGILA